MADQSGETVVVTPGTTDANAAHEEETPSVPAGSVTHEGGASGQQWRATGGVNPACKVAIKDDLTSQIKNWFGHRKTSQRRSNKNPFIDWLDGFQRPTAALRKLPLYKFYMQQEDYAELVEERFQKTWPAAGLKQKFALDFRCKCAKDLLEEEDPEVQEELAATHGAEHEQVLAEHYKGIDCVGNPELPDEVKHENCCKNLAQVAQPFLDRVAKLTGLHVTLLTGSGPPDGSDKCMMTLLHSGRTVSIGGVEGQKFHEWDPQGYKKNIIGHFMRFLLETTEHTATRVVPGTGAAWVVPERPTNTGATSIQAVLDLLPSSAAPTTMDAGGADTQANTNTNAADADIVHPTWVSCGRKAGKKRKRTEAAETPSPANSHASSTERSRTPSPERPPSPPPIYMQRTTTPVLPASHVLMPAMEAHLAVINFTRENTLVRNAALLKALNIQSGSAQIFGPRPTPKPRKEQLAVPTAPTHRSTRLNQPGQREDDDGAAAGGGGAKGAGAGAGEMELEIEKEADAGEKEAEVEGEGEGAGEMEVEIEKEAGVEEKEAEVEGEGEGAGEKEVGAGEKEAEVEKETRMGEKEVEMEVEVEKEAEKESEGRREKNAEGGTGSGESTPQLDRSGWPRWMTEEYTLLSACPAGDAEWHMAVWAWAALDRAYGFKTSTIALPTASRPAEVGEWIKYRRSTTREIKIKDFEAFRALWWKWGALVHPGANGMGIVLLPLVWWRQAEQGDVASDSWLHAVRDVAWALKSLLSAAKSKKHILSEPPEATEPPRKKRARC
ncbi:hypothetical protein FB451DRAFT_1405848 [Mycena latifolia]|nr:hypothetical protein FB451DRAFT_1405848 [Mycena latifolia]